MIDQRIAPVRLFGLGLRPPHYNDFLTGEILVDFVEVISENFMIAGGRPLRVLEKIRERYAVALHGVSLSVGSVSSLRQDYLLRLKSLADRFDPLWVLDHLCWTGIDGFNSHDLLPLPYMARPCTLCARIFSTPRKCSNALSCSKTRRATSASRRTK
jgi:uncharacterized protein